jgi:hypothetical protein
MHPYLKSKDVSLSRYHLIHASNSVYLILPFEAYIFATYDRSSYHIENELCPFRLNGVEETRDFIRISDLILQGKCVAFLVFIVFPFRANSLCEKVKGIDSILILEKAIEY